MESAVDIGKVVWANDKDLSWWPALVVDYAQVLGEKTDSKTVNSNGRFVQLFNVNKPLKIFDKSQLKAFACDTFYEEQIRGCDGTFERKKAAISQAFLQTTCDVNNEPDETPADDTSLDESFAVGTVLWVDLDGYPWWPARVVTKKDVNFTSSSYTDVPLDAVLVQFFNDNDRFTIISKKRTAAFQKDRFYDTRLRHKSGFSRAIKKAVNEAWMYLGQPQNGVLIPNTSIDTKRPRGRPRKSDSIRLNLKEVNKTKSSLEVGKDSNAFHSGPHRSKPKFGFNDENHKRKHRLSGLDLKHGNVKSWTDATSNYNTDDHPSDEQTEERASSSLKKSSPSVLSPSKIRETLTFIPFPTTFTPRNERSECLPDQIAQQYVEPNFAMPSEKNQSDESRAWSNSHSERNAKADARLNDSSVEKDRSGVASLKAIHKPESDPEKELPRENLTFRDFTEVTCIEEERAQVETDRVTSSREMCEKGKCDKWPCVRIESVKQATIAAAAAGTGESIVAIPMNEQIQETGKVPLPDDPPKALHKLDAVCANQSMECDEMTRIKQANDQVAPKKENTPNNEEGYDASDNTARGQQCKRGLSNLTPDIQTKRCLDNQEISVETPVDEIQCVTLGGTANANEKCIKKNEQKRLATTARCSVLGKCCGGCHSCCHMMQTCCETRKRRRKASRRRSAISHLANLADALADFVHFMKDDVLGDSDDELKCKVDTKGCDQLCHHYHGERRIHLQRKQED